MSTHDQARWQERYTGKEPDKITNTFPHALFASAADHFPTTGLALDIACGRGAAAVWLAKNGMLVQAVDISPAAIELAHQLAEQHNVANQCQFEVFDLDHGLPKTPTVDLLLCHNYRNPDLYAAMIERLKPGGLLAIVTLSEFGGHPGKYRSTPHELINAFSTLHVIMSGEADGRAWLLARKSESP